MTINRMSAALLLFAASLPTLAAVPLAPTPSCEDVAAQALSSLSLADSLSPLGDYVVLPSLDAPDGLVAAAQAPSAAPPREVLAAFAMTLRDIRYRRGGREPTTGFDCSGFVQYVFAHSLGIDLPDVAESQFQTGRKVTRAELRTGDLVFFHTRGKSVSHVGIYLDGGRFIHSPSTGKRVRVDELSDPYWAKRFIAAKRPITTA
jgi:cell wall-associated NlpC family hydrolase